MLHLSLLLNALHGSSCNGPIRETKKMSKTGEQQDERAFLWLIHYSLRFLLRWEFLKRRLAVLVPYLVPAVEGKLPIRMTINLTYTGYYKASWVLSSIPLDTRSCSFRLRETMGLYVKVLAIVSCHCLAAWLLGPFLVNVELYRQFDSIKGAKSVWVISIPSRNAFYFNVPSPSKSKLIRRHPFPLENSKGKESKNVVAVADRICPIILTSLIESLGSHRQRLGNRAFRIFLFSFFFSWRTNTVRLIPSRRRVVLAAAFDCYGVVQKGSITHVPPL